MAAWLARQAARRSNIGALQASLAMVLQFDTYLRPSAVLQLQRISLIPPAAAAGRCYDRWALI
eukprot:7637768-Lingulodinium_polyedra.AAC.1